MAGMEERTAEGMAGQTEAWSRGSATQRPTNVSSASDTGLQGSQQAHLQQPEDLRGLRHAGCTSRWLHDQEPCSTGVQGRHRDMRGMHGQCELCW
jgi:hypothetical protein